VLRYCTYCNKDYEFEAAAITAKDNLICPACGNVINKNSRHPSNTTGNEIEDGIGNVVSNVFRLAWIFYLALGLIGIICYFTHLDKALYIVTAISLLAYIIQLFTGTLVFTAGIILLPVAAIIGFFLFNGCQGACLGIMLVFIIRHIIRNIIWAIIEKFINQQ